jgi:hypothetical protein
MMSPASLWRPRALLFLAATGLLWCGASSAFAQDETLLIDDDVNQGKIIIFTGPDDLHFDPATAIIAVDVYGDDDVDVNGVTFIADKTGDTDVGEAEANGVTVTTTAANQIDAWSATTTFEGADQDSADNLATVMESIRWNGAPNSIDIAIEGLDAGATYEVQLLFNEGRGPQRWRVWDIMVQDELVADNIASIGRYLEDSWDNTNSAAYVGVFVASAEGTLNIEMAQDLGGEQFPGGTDNNPILNAIVVHSAGLDPALAGWWKLTEGAGEELNDSSGNNEPAELVEGDWEAADGDNLPGFLAGASVPSFDGDATVALLGEGLIPVLDENSALSIAFWTFQVGGGTGGNEIALGNRWNIDGVDDAPREFIKFTPTKFEFHQEGNGSQDVAYDEPIPDDEWVHHAIVKDGPVFTYYRNGEEVNSRENDGAYPLNPQPLFLGGQRPGGGEHWSGRQADVGLWTRALSDDEVEAIAADGIVSIAGETDLDSDGDGMSDSYEEKNDLDPNVADAAEDKDGDGLTNKEEHDGTSDGDGNRIRPQTFANKADSDDDGLGDKVETNTGTWVGAADTGTNPLREDTDKDDLKDGVETNTGVFVDANNTGTDPLNEDSDGDGKKDGREVANNTDPLDPKSPLPPDPNEIVVAYWALDDNLDDAIGDSHGELMDGDDDIPDFVEGKLGGALSLDGVGEFVEINPDNEDLLSGFDENGEQAGFSISSWFKVGAFEKTWQCLVAKGEGNRWRIHRRGGESIMTGNGGNADVSAGSIAVDDDEWHHLALISTPEEGVVLYVDGEIEGESGPPNLQDNDNPMMIGENPDARNRTWNGLVDDLAFFKVPITEEQVLEMWNDGEGKTVGEVFLGLSGGLPFQITEIVREGNTVTITWPSREGQSFIVEQTTDLESFEELTDGHPSGGETTSFEVTLPDPSPEELYLRVTREE